MGLIRFLLALSVVADHSNTAPLLKLVGGPIAVESFFIISGFYMAMVYGNYASKLNFWKSRYLRLFPTYFICCLISLFVVKDASQFINQLFSLPVSASLFLLFTNITMLFQDVTMFLAVEDGALHFTDNFIISDPKLYTFLLIPQAWSIGLEVTFYLLVPFIIPKSVRLILLVVCISLLLKIGFNHYGLDHDPWTYRFFPSELSLFLLGSISYKLYRKVSFSTQLTWGMVGTLMVLFYICFYPVFAFDQILKKYVLYFMLILSIGFIFDYSKNSKIDAFFGGLSYPIYISHLMLLAYTLPKFPYLRDAGSISSTVLIYMVVSLFAIAIYYFVERPVDAFRVRFK